MPLGGTGCQCEVGWHPLGVPSVDLIDETFIVADPLVVAERLRDDRVWQRWWPDRRLVVFMDINWSEASFRSTNWSSVAQNVALFLSGLSDPPGPVVAPGASVFASRFVALPPVLSSSTAP